MSVRPGENKPPPSGKGEPEVVSETSEDVTEEIKDE